MIFGRVKPLDAILATAEKKSLHRSLGAFQLTMLGIGAVIGTGIFVLTAEAAQKAGPGMMICVHHRGTGLCGCGTLLCRNVGDGPGFGVGLYL
jgi:amino acid permease